VITTVSPQVLTEFPSAESNEDFPQRNFELLRAALMGGDDRAVVSGASHALRLPANDLNGAERLNGLERFEQASVIFRHRC
jgi:hypothetical protein